MIMQFSFIEKLILQKTHSFSANYITLVSSISGVVFRDKMSYYLFCLPALKKLEVKMAHFSGIFKRLNFSCFYTCALIRSKKRSTQVRFNIEI